MERNAVRVNLLTFILHFLARLGDRFARRGHPEVLFLGDYRSGCVITLGCDYCRLGNYRRIRKHCRFPPGSN